MNSLQVGISWIHSVSAQCELVNLILEKCWHADLWNILSHVLCLI